MNTRPGLVLELQTARQRIRDLETATGRQLATIDQQNDRLRRYACAVGERDHRNPDRFCFTIVFDRNHARASRSPEDYLDLLLEEMRHKIRQEIPAHFFTR